jgi:hypothetical protein
LFNNDNISRAEKELELEKIECILDFTLRMNNDLNTIYFESVFLQKNNEEIVASLEQLFKSYTKPIAYSSSLSICREKDDWESVIKHLTMYFDKIKELLPKQQTNELKIEAMQIDIMFPVDQLIQFINEYNAFINQSSKFYEKFGAMLASYENESVCAGKLPTEYHSLKQNINTTGEKFISAYKPIEINGSKLKQLLYGISEYD